MTNLQRFGGDRLSAAAVAAAQTGFKAQARRAASSTRSRRLSRSVRRDFRCNGDRDELIRRPTVYSFAHNNRRHVHQRDSVDAPVTRLAHFTGDSWPDIFVANENGNMESTDNVQGKGDQAALNATGASTGNRRRYRRRDLAGDALALRSKPDISPTRRHRRWRSVSRSAEIFNPLDVHVAKNDLSRRALDRSGTVSPGQTLER